MYYTRYMFVTKGKLSKIWIAAHWERKLKKKDYEGVNVANSVEDIMEPVGPLSLRLQGQLLVGVARVYSHQVKYLFNDAQNAMTRVKSAYHKKKSVVDLPEDHRGARNIDLDEDQMENLFDIGDNPLDELKRLEEDEDAQLMGSQYVARKEDITLQNDTHSELSLDLPLGADALLASQLPLDGTDMEGELGLDDFMREEGFDVGVDMPDDMEISMAGDSTMGFESSRADTTVASMRSRKSRKGLDGDTESEAKISDIEMGRDAGDMSAAVGDASEVDISRALLIDNKSELSKDGKESLIDLPPASPSRASLDAPLDMGLDMLEGMDDQPVDGISMMEFGDQTRDSIDIDAEEEGEEGKEPEASPKKGRGRKRKAAHVDKRTELTAQKFRSWQDNAGPITTERVPVSYTKRFCGGLVATSARQHLAMMFERPSSFLVEDGGGFSASLLNVFSSCVHKNMGSKGISKEEEEEEDEKQAGEEKEEERELEGEEKEHEYLPEDVEMELPDIDVYDAFQGDNMSTTMGDMSSMGGGAFGDSTTVVIDEAADNFFTQESQASKKDESVASAAQSGWSSRTIKMYTVLDKEDEEAVSFEGMIQGFGRRSAAGVFHELLVLKTHGMIGVEQETPFGDITVTKTDKFRKNAPPSSQFRRRVSGESESDA